MRGGPAGRRLAPAAAAASLALAACTSMAPPYQRPTAPVAATFPLAAPSEAAATPAPQLPWKRFFGDARLQRLIELSLAHNRDLRVAAANIEAARAQLTVRRADLWPTVNVGATATRQTATPTSQYAAGFTVSAFELDLWGRVRSLTDAALAQLAATEEARRAAQVSLVASVANAYYATAGDDVLLDLTRRTMQTRRESLALVKLRFDNGVASELDLRAAQTAVESARSSLAQLQRQRQLDLNALQLLVGQPLPDGDGLPAPNAWSPDALADVPAGLPSDVLLQRPDVLQAEAQLRAANASIGAARAAFWPRITLTGSIGAASPELSNLFSDGTAWSFSPQVLLPLFDAGRNSANLRISEAQRDAAVAQYERAVQAAFRDVADALAGRATLAEQLQALTAQSDAEAARLKLTELRFRSGVAGSLELLDAQRSLYAVQQQRVQVELALLQNRVAAYRALGGGWEELSGPAGSAR